jgi:D-glutamate N-acetyltransferase
MQKRYLVLAEGRSGDPHYGKTARGVIRYAPEKVVAVLDSQRAGESYEGFPIVGTVEEALPLEPTTALVGVATAGGRFPPEWRELLKECLRAGLDIENGLHQRLGNDPELVELARDGGASLVDLRRPPDDLNVPTGANLDAPARIVLTVGSDCAIGKMTVALELDAEARRRGIASVFVPTGQTGIAIAGWGIAVDAVVADFIAGASERLVLEGVERGGELLWVEGQGSLTHPQFSGVTLGLFHGSAPHALVLCHVPGQEYVNDEPRFPMPSLSSLVELHERTALIARPSPVAAIALNTRGMEEEAAQSAITDAERETGLVADDPVRFGPGRVVDAVLARLGHNAS